MMMMITEQRYANVIMFFSRKIILILYAMEGIKYEIHFYLHSEENSFKINKIRAVEVIYLCGRESLSHCTNMHTRIV